MHTQMQDDGQIKQVSLNLAAQDRPVLGFSPGGQHQFKIGGYQLSVRRASDLDDIPWAFARGVSDE